MNAFYFNKKARLDGTLNQLQFTTTDGRRHFLGLSLCRR
jgi:hypothetical protein